MPSAMASAGKITSTVSDLAGSAAMLHLSHNIGWTAFLFRLASPPRPP
jgi:hypothetical protein